MDIIVVDIFSPFSSVQGWFTRKNSSVVNKDGKIPGLNLGLNTGVDPQEIRANQQVLKNALQIDDAEVALARQIHGDHIEVVDSDGIYSDTDALITESPGLVLAIQVADCAAVLIGDPESGIVAAVHAGWRGAVSEILPKTLDKLKRTGNSRPDRMLAYISPAICKKHFEVGPEVSKKFPSHFVDETSYHKPHVDLKGYLRQQLQDSGVPEKQIQTDPVCTMCEGEKYYSFRNEQEQAGRMWGLIQLKSQKSKVKSEK